MSKYCNLSDTAIKKQIARDFDLPQHLYLGSWIKCAAVLRNCIAHHARVWNRRFPLKPQLPKKETVPNLVDLTTDEYSFVIKCPASRHLPVRRKTPPPCRGGGSKSRRGFPSTYHSARETKQPLWPPHGKQKGRYDPARETKRPLWPPHGEQKGRYAPKIRMS